MLALSTTSTLWSQAASGWSQISHPPTLLCRSGARSYLMHAAIVDTDALTVPVGRSVFAVLRMPTCAGPLVCGWKFWTWRSRMRQTNGWLFWSFAYAYHRSPWDHVGGNQR